MLSFYFVCKSVQCKGSRSLSYTIKEFICCYLTFLRSYTWITLYCILVDEWYKLEYAAYNINIGWFNINVNSLKSYLNIFMFEIGLSTTLFNPSFWEVSFKTFKFRILMHINVSVWGFLLTTHFREATHSMELVWKWAKV